MPNALNKPHKLFFLSMVIPVSLNKRTGVFYLVGLGIKMSSGTALVEVALLWSAFRSGSAMPIDKLCLPWSRLSP